MKAQTLLANIRNKSLLGKRAGLLAGTAARDASVSQVGVAHRVWIDQCLAIIKTFTKGAHFSADDLWDRVKGSVAEPRAMGAVMTEAKALGLIEATGEYQKSSRAVCHARPVAVWKIR